MHPLMMQEMARERVKNARRQAEAHRRAHQARAARQKEMAGAAGKVAQGDDGDPRQPGQLASTTGN